MADEALAPLLVILSGLAARARTGLSQRIHHGGAEDGVTTLELVIITLGLIAVATLLVAAITTAVTRRTNQIK